MIRNHRGKGPLFLCCIFFTLLGTSCGSGSGNTNNQISSKETVVDDAINCDIVDSKLIREFESKFEKSQNPILLVQEGCNGYPDLSCGRTAILMDGKVIRGHHERDEKQWHDKVIGEFPPWYITKLQCKLHYLKKVDLKWTNNEPVFDGGTGGYYAQNSDGDMIPLFQDARGNSGKIEQYKFTDELIRLIDALYLLKLGKTADNLKSV